MGDWQQAEPLCCSWLSIRGGWVEGGGPHIPGILVHSCLIVPVGGARLLSLPLTQGWEHSFLLIHPRECFGSMSGAAGPLGGHLRHEQPGVDLGLWQQGNGDLADKCHPEPH